MIGRPDRTYGYVDFEDEIDATKAVVAVIDGG
jgi:hypothetical protein